MAEDFTHFDEQGRAQMVDVTAKDQTDRVAVAVGEVRMSPEAFALVQSGGMKKGDVLAVAQLAGIMGAKRTADLIPLCHPLPISGVRLALLLVPERHAVAIEAEVKTTGRTGVEMEALTAVSVAALTVYDMCKAVDTDMRIEGIRLAYKAGGRRGVIDQRQG